MVNVEIEPLSVAHDRNDFSCGVDVLDRYLRQQAGQDVRRHVANCFVATESGTGKVAAYYTFAAAAVATGHLPPDLTRRLPRYDALPAALIGRLAVDLRYARKGLGTALVFDALERALKADPAVFVLLVDAKDESVAEFYRRCEFRPLAKSPPSLYLPIETVRRMKRG
jgi:predicted N-acetyltransferase YhbS